MEKYVLDSDMIWILYDDTRKEFYRMLHAHLATLHDDDILQTSVLVLYELQYSLFNAPEDKKTQIKAAIEHITRDFVIVPVDLLAAPLFGEIKAHLKREKNLNRKEMRKHNIDIVLASTAISTSSILISADSIYDDIQRFYSTFRRINWLHDNA